MYFRYPRGELYGSGYIRSTQSSLSLKCCTLFRFRCKERELDSSERTRLVPSVFEISLSSSDTIRLSQIAGNDGRPFFWLYILKSNISFSPSYFYHSDTRMRIRRIDHRPRPDTPSSRLGERDPCALFGGIAIHRHTLRGCPRSD